MYFAASMPPRVPGPRPSNRSSARYLRCASMARALGLGRRGTGRGAATVVVTAASRKAVVRRIIECVAPRGLVRAAHGVDGAAAEKVGLARGHERRVVEKIDRLSNTFESGDGTNGPDRTQPAAGPGNEEVDLRVGAHRHQRPVAPDARVGD